MSLSGALNSSVSALKAQSTAIAVVSDNLANSSTYGYKTTIASFEALVTGSSSAGYSAGGVLSGTRSNIAAQGQLTRTTSVTDLAIQGNGFFVVESATGANTFYARNGQFDIDKNGYLVNNGYQLLGWQTDIDGSLTAAATAGNLEPIYTNIKPSCANPTTSATVVANLPSNAAAGFTGTMDVEVFDSQGNPHTVTLEWVKDANNDWGLTYSVPAPATITAPVMMPVDVTFNPDGSIDPLDALQDVDFDWANGTTNPQTINFNFSSLTQLASSNQQIDLRSINSDGTSYGTLTGIAIDEGYVNATYSNGETIPIYKIAVATFTNPNGLLAQSGGLYSQSGTSGNATLQEPGVGGAGMVYGSTLESSKTDTSQEFSTMITAQQAYSASAQVISTVSKMYDTLMSAMR
ncbi:MAG: flagellar hook protein FlgE [Methylacidiphilales bacterium]|nr:flagellar hook protein FlgE [Candidatus Methylacidiphilales bacterium]